MDDHAFARFAEGGAHAVLDRLSGDAAFAEPAAALLERFRAPWDRAARLALAAEYGRLFHGAGGRRAVPPSQSAFLNEASHGAPWRAMTALLADSGAAVPAGCSEPADHIAVELTVMAELAGRGAVTDNPAARRLRAEQADFLDIHLLTWLPDFARDCAQFDSRGVYGALATATHDFITDDRTRLAA